MSTISMDRRTCFDNSSLDEDNTDQSSIHSSESLIDKAFTYTRRYKLQSLIGEAVNLQQRNSVIASEVKRKRRNKIRSLGKKLPRLADFVPIPKTAPYIRFRKLARSILLLIKICNVCRRSIMRMVKNEAWFALIDNIVANTNLMHKRKPTRSFVTFVPNEERELIQLTFDVGEFKRDYISQFILTDETRRILQNSPGTRKPEEIVKVLRVVKAICKDFCKYPLTIQKKICQRAFYDKYHHNRVITRKGLHADGLFIVMAGTLIEKVDGQRQPREITVGQVFGEEDLICGRNRRRTIITKVETELLYLHRIDYWEIFSMTEDAMNTSNLDICKQDVVFQHFPMHRLIDNPGTWTVMKYKYGRLIVPDSNKVDWIYVIKSGEARVYKYLSPGPVDVKARRKKVQTMLNEQSPFYRRKQMLDFIEDRDYIKSSYKPGSYNPAKRAGVKSAPPGKARDVRFNAHKIAAAFASLPITPKTGVATKPEVRLETRLPQIILPEEDEDNNSKCSNDSDEHKESDNRLNLTDLPEGAAGYLNRERRPSLGLGLGIPMRNRSGSFMRTPMTSRAKPEQFVKVGRTTFPAFVHVETLHPGHTFGLRACLDADEMGPSVSLVSGDCEVLQINRKYFMKHCDDALYSLIRLKAKRFPSQEELIDRLDANIQWEEFKQLTLDTFLQQYREKKQIF